MKLKLNWKEYENAGLGDAYADIPKNGGDFAKAVAVCINSMHCLQAFEKSVMCPSYRATNDIHFSPGGRSRLIKKMLNNEITDEEQETLDKSMAACVGCKGCKRECDSALDMAQIKAEYTNLRNIYKQHALRNYSFAAISKLLRFNSFYSLISSSFNQFQSIRDLSGRLLGVNINAPLPQPIKSTPDVATVNDDSPDLLLFVDTFTKHFSPDTISSAVKVLTLAGFRPKLIGLEKNYTAGRSWFSQGYIDSARSELLSLLELVKPYLNKEIPLVGLEPSCLSMFRNELPSLIDSENALALSKNSWLFEEFIGKRIAANDFSLELEPQSDVKVLVHGHCHQKSLGALKSMRKVLKLVPDLEFEFINSSCCGGAGSFAHESEHEQLSKNMYELGLKQALEDSKESIVVAMGFSCQQQMKNHSQRPSIHLADFLAQRIKS